MKRKLLIAVSVIVILALISSGWVYNMTQEKKAELESLKTTFTQQYGEEAVIKQIASQKKMYSALWTSADGRTHVSWRVGGLWVTVWNSPAPTIPTPTP